MIKLYYTNHGIFKEEIKNRFRSIVEIDDNDEICYIQSSSRLENYLDLNGKEVLVKEIEAPNKIKNTVLAVSYKSDKILLCPSMANEVVLSEIHRRLFSYLGKRKEIRSEYKVQCYKSDIYIFDTKTIIEIKCLISDKKNGNYFPIVYSERTEIQLEQLIRLKKEGYNPVFMIISFNPYYKSINIMHDTPFYSKMQECIKEGILFKAYSITCKNDLISIKRELSINY